MAPHEMFAGRLRKNPKVVQNASASTTSSITARISSADIGRPAFSLRGTAPSNHRVDGEVSFKRSRIVERRQSAVRDARAAMRASRLKS